MTARCEKFARQLRGRFSRPALLVDERYTSVEAARLLSGGKLTGQRRKQAIDAEAAAQILRRFFAEGAIDIDSLAATTAH
jgi:putative Holliday junction resolvase